MENYLNTSKKYKGYHYSVLEPEMLEYLHLKTTEMLHEVIKILEKNDICYMIVGGTLLGAVTTGHFIPWDDDVDLCVPDENYEKMIDCLMKELPGWMIVQCKHTEPGYYHSWIKIRDTNSNVFPSEAQYKQNGVWIDIYRLISVREKDIPYKIIKEHIDYLNRRFSYGIKAPKERLKRIHENKLIYRLAKEKVKALFSRKREKVYLIWSASKVMVRPEWCFPVKRYPFEGMYLTGFKNAECYLTEHYGKNFMEKPSDEMRRTGIYKVEFKREDSNVE